ncbi:MAG: sigma 54-interacting transcriptional regulator, partial [Acidobacteriota bacterium]
LLRALESEEILPVGGVEPQRIDVRVIAATDARLEEAMESGRFRAPLYHRLAGYTLRLPPLRERLDDLGQLLRVFLEEEAAALHAETAATAPAIPAPLAPFPSAEVVTRLAKHSWPGNVRELRNVARRLALQGDGPRSQVRRQLEDLLETAPDRPGSPPGSPPSEASNTSTAPPRPEPTPRRRRRNPSKVSEEELLAALETHAYRMRHTAEALGLSRIGLYRRLEASPNVRKAADLLLPEIEDAVAAADGDLGAAALSLRVSLQGLKRQITALRRSPR